jgi:hypothetical protein
VDVCVAFYSDQIKNAESAGRVSFTPQSKIWLTAAIFMKPPFAE